MLRSVLGASDGRVYLWNTFRNGDAKSTKFPYAPIPAPEQEGGRTCITPFFCVLYET